MDDRTAPDIVERLLAPGHGALADEAAHEIERLRRAVAYARVRLKQPAYAERMDKIVSGDLDAEYAAADFTPMTRGRSR